jgi:hypothetical protein
VLASREPALTALARSLSSHPVLGGEAPPRIDAPAWNDAIALANEHFLCPAVYASLSAADALGTVPDEVRDYLHHLYRANRRRNRIVRRQAIEIVRELNREGIVPLLLKGILTLVSEPTTDPAARMMVDIDIAVPRSAELAAVRVLHRLRYIVRNRYPEGHHAYAEFGRDGSPAAVDLHFELIDQSYVLPAAEVWRRARRSVAVDGATFFTPWPTHRILHNVLHAQVHHRGAFYSASLDLRQLHEFALLSKAYGASVHWGYVRDRLDRHHLGTPLLSYIWAAHRLFGAAWPYREAAEMGVKLHYSLCRAQLRYPGLRRLGIPWGNLSAALAWHRMASLYGALDRHSRRMHHVRRVLTTHSLSFVVGRLFRN